MKRPDKLKSLNGWWVVCYASGVVAQWSISGTRKGAISAFLEDSNFKWEDSAEHGWYTMKVNIDFTIFSKL